MTSSSLQASTQQCIARDEHAIIYVRPENDADIDDADDDVYTRLMATGLIVDEGSVLYALANKALLVYIVYYINIAA